MKFGPKHNVSAWLSVSIVPVSFRFGVFLRVLAITPRETRGKPWRRSEETTASIDTDSLKVTFDLPLDAPRGLHLSPGPFGRAIPFCRLFPNAAPAPTVSD